MDEKEFGVYDDLGENTDLGAQIHQLQERNTALETHIESLGNYVTALNKEIEQLKTTQENLKKNVSELFYTAKAEIGRKDRMIADLQQQIDDLILRRNNRADSRKRPIEDEPDTYSKHTDNVSKRAKYNEKSDIGQLREERRNSEDNRQRNDRRREDRSRHYRDRDSHSRRDHDSLKSRDSHHRESSRDRRSHKSDDCKLYDHKINDHRSNHQISDHKTDYKIKDHKTDHRVNDHKPDHKINDDKIIHKVNDNKTDNSADNLKHRQNNTADKKDDGKKQKTDKVHCEINNDVKSKKNEIKKHGKSDDLIKRSEENPVNIGNSTSNGHVKVDSDSKEVSKLDSEPYVMLERSILIDEIQSNSTHEIDGNKTVANTSENHDSIKLEKAVNTITNDVKMQEDFHQNHIIKQDIPKNDEKVVITNITTISNVSNDMTEVLSTSAQELQNAINSIKNDSFDIKMNDSFEAVTENTASNSVINLNNVMITSSNGSNMTNDITSGHNMTICTNNPTSNSDSVVNNSNNCNNTINGPTMISNNSRRVFRSRRKRCVVMVSD